MSLASESSACHSDVRAGETDTFLEAETGAHTHTHMGGDVQTRTQADGQDSSETAAGLNAWPD